MHYNALSSLFLHDLVYFAFPCTLKCIVHKSGFLKLQDISVILTELNIFYSAGPPPLLFLSNSASTFFIHTF